MLLGFESIKSDLLKLYQDHKLHHAILLSGKKGIGKSSFAKELAATILNDNLSNHPDLFLIEKDPEKKEIGVDKIRKIANFSNQTSAISASKFIIVDSACELTNAASNALLKILEEPRQNNFLILISHNLNRVLPTIRSRCQIVKIPDLAFESFSEILRKKNSSLSLEEILFLSEICDNSLSDALSAKSDLSRLYQLFLFSIHNKKISEELIKKVADKNFSFVTFEKIFTFFITRLIKFSSKIEERLFFDEVEIFSNLTKKKSQEQIFTIADECLTMARQTTSLNLDKKLSLVNIFNRICHE